MRAEIIRDPVSEFSQGTNRSVLPLYMFLKEAFLNMSFRVCPMKYKLFFIIGLFLASAFFPPFQALAQKEAASPALSISRGLIIKEAVMCEGIKDYRPQCQAIVFSVEIGQVSCFTSFDPVPEKMFIYHNWFHRDKLSTRIRLILQPPRWSTFSSIQLRETDKGPWRVEITDSEGNVLRILRFSITD
ncbi:MAG TPA: DUF2914 domain-containing protein [Desulfobacterales bacterium]|nr:DUF2914 domain-containing protein [Desulfobacterales bacterium]